MNGRLTPVQWGALLWTVCLAPAAELLPGVCLAPAGRGAWLSPLAALPLLALILWAGGQGGAHVLGAAPPGRLFLVWAAVWMELLLALRLTLCARRMLRAGERDGAVWYFVLVLAALTLWMCRRRLSVLGRAGQIYLGLLLGAAALVLGLSLPEVRADRLLPLWTGDILPVLASAPGAAGGLCWGVLPMLLLPRREERGHTIIIVWCLGGCLLLTAAQVIILGNLGSVLAGQTDSAFFTLTKSVGIEGAFQRVESVVAALWMLSDLTGCAVLAQAIGRAVEELLPGLRREDVSPWAVVPAAAAALWLTRSGADAEGWNRSWVGTGTLISALLCAFGLYWGRVSVKKTKKG